MDFQGVRSNEEGPEKQGTFSFINKTFRLVALSDYLSLVLPAFFLTELSGSLYQVAVPCYPQAILILKPFVSI